MTGGPHVAGTRWCRPGRESWTRTVKPNGIDRDDIETGHILARHAAVAVANATHEQNLREALEGRSLIGQAQGILMERYDLDADRAFAVLRRYSQDTNTRLSRVAEQLIDARTLPDRPSHRSSR